MFGERGVINKSSRKKQFRAGFRAVLYIKAQNKTSTTIDAKSQPKGDNFAAFSPVLNRALHSIHVPPPAAASACTVTEQADGRPTSCTVHRKRSRSRTHLQMSAHWGREELAREAVGRGGPMPRGDRLQRGPAATPGRYAKKLDVCYRREGVAWYEKHPVGHAVGGACAQA